MLATLGYAGENRGCLPYPNWANMASGYMGAGWLYLPVAGQPFTATTEQTGVLWPWMKNPGFYKCQLDHGPFLPGSVHLMTSYIMNGAVIGFRTGYKSNSLPVKILQMQPGDCVLFEADDSDPWYFNDGSSWPSEGITARHLQGATLAAVEGSASYIRDDEWLNEVNYTNKNHLWCYPGSGDGGDPVYGHVLFNN